MRATRSKRLFACNDAVAGGRQSSSPVGLQSRFQSGHYKHSFREYRPGAMAQKGRRFRRSVAQRFRRPEINCTGTRFGKAVHTAMPETGGGGPRSSTARVGVTLNSRDNGMPNANRTARAAVPNPPQESSSTSPFNFLPATKANYLLFTAPTIRVVGLLLS